METHRDLLGDLRVLEVGTFVAVPFAGHLLQGLGAEVVKVTGEPDPASTMPLGSRVSLYEYLNGGKRTVAAEFPLGSGQLDELSAGVDVVIGDSRSVPGEWEPRPGLVAAILSVTGQANSPLADSALICARSGISWAMGDPGRAPLRMPAYTADSLLGLVFAGVALARVLAGAHGKHTTHGLAALSAFVEQNSVRYRITGTGFRRDGRRTPGHGGIYPYAIYDCRDGQVALIARSKLQWMEMAQGLGAGNILDDYPDPVAIARASSDEVDVLLAQVLSQLTRAEIAELAETKGILAAPVLSTREVLGFEHLAFERGFWIDLDGQRVPGYPFVVRA